MIEHDVVFRKYDLHRPFMILKLIVLQVFKIVGQEAEYSYRHAAL